MDDDEVETVRNLFWGSLDDDGVGAGIVWRTERDAI